MKLIIVLIILFLSSCATKPVVLGDAVTPPIGYALHCRDNPTSVFCVQEANK